MASKIHFTKNIDDLEHFVDRGHIPKELGGGEDWAYHYVEPRPGENAQMADEAARSELLEERQKTVESFEMSTQKWLSTAAAGQDVTAEQKERHSLANQLREGYWQLDPFLRARTLYERTGMIQPNGRIVFYGEKPSGKESQINGEKTPNQITSNDDID